MSEKNSSQSQHETAADPLRAGLDAWAEMASRAAERWTACWGEMTGIEGRLHEQGARALEESARLQAEAVKLALELARESRRLALDTARRAAEMWAPA
ncbi:MAG TPA: hypothetical protein VNO33_21840 [Kofleriaceae bacterium]|nr:hypothetical protein [Kofleriaceae bacterium]